jgi:C-terminal processing protease CtpA/Prc
MVDVAAAATVMIAHTDAVIVDLRGVPGGWPSGCDLLLGHFLPADPTLSLTMTKRDGEPEEQWTPKDNPLDHRPDVPLFVLVDGKSASAAEAFAYGEQTPGAANPGDFFPIGEEFAAFIPTMAPIDPRTGGNWEGTGVRPDVVVGSDQTLARAVELARAAIGG